MIRRRFENYIDVKKGDLKQDPDAFVEIKGLLLT